MIKEPVTGDKRWSIRWLRRPLEICCLHHIHLSAGGACHTAGAGAGFVPSVLGPQEPGGSSLLRRRHTHTAQQSSVTEVWREQPRLLWVSLFSQSSPLLFFFSVEALFYNCEWEVSRFFHIVGPHYRAARIDTPKARNLFQISDIFILPCPTRRPRDYR